MYSDDNIKNLIVFGDWHGNTRYAEKHLRKIGREERIPDAYVHVGDFGVWRDSAGFLRNIERILAFQGVELWFVDGNHEDFTLLKEYPFDNRGLQKVTEHIFRIPRGYAWRWSGKKLVGLGGAFSVDRRWGTENIDWFAEETITEDDFRTAVCHDNADILFSHDAPWLPSNLLSRKSLGVKFALTEDEEKAAAEGRDYIARTIEKLGVKLHIHGHYHVAYTADFFGTQVIGLDCDNSRMNDNGIEVDLTEI